MACEVHLEIATRCFARLKERRRALAGRTGCGLCGIDSLQALDLVPERVRARPWAAALPAGVVLRAVAAMPALQVLNAAAGALHAAAWATPDGELTDLLEDVGRHNALDKLIGRLALQGRSGEDGFVVMSSRASYELVRKCARLDIPLLATVSAPTSWPWTWRPRPASRSGACAAHPARCATPPAPTPELRSTGRSHRCRGARACGLPDPGTGCGAALAPRPAFPFRRHIPYGIPIFRFPHAVPFQPAAAGRPARPRSAVLRHFRRGRGRPGRGVRQRDAAGQRPGRRGAAAGRIRPARRAGRARSAPGHAPLAPGDEAAPGTPGTGENLLPCLRRHGPARRRALHRMRRHRPGDRRHRRRLSGAPAAVALVPVRARSAPVRPGAPARRRAAVFALR